ncbi:unnamed protein product [Plutella xylostella]|uniref:(diamondback moth) hypothetical protein n=1 Tax=Plutella xylostella TaxID=51655 RepID=A0A8S4G5I6_PLUXY|nr:unnamed protein product [Plutella xylostella]
MNFKFTALWYHSLSFLMLLPIMTSRRPYSIQNFQSQPSPKTIPVSNYDGSTTRAPLKLITPVQNRPASDVFIKQTVPMTASLSPKSPKIITPVSTSSSSTSLSSTASSAAKKALMTLNLPKNSPSLPSVQLSISSSPSTALCMTSRYVAPALPVASSSLDNDSIVSSELARSVFNHANEEFVAVVDSDYEVSCTLSTTYCNNKKSSVILHKGNDENIQLNAEF